MLTITIKGDEFWDEEIERFTYTDDLEVQFEHSLVSLSKWEAKYHKPFLTNDKRTDEEMLGYIVAMILTPGVTEKDLQRLSVENVQALNDYINDPMTGSTIAELPGQGRSTERISAELIYFWMSHYNVPYEAREWHLNQLFTLIKIHYAKTQKPKKMSAQSRAQQMAEENRRRRAATGSKG